MVENAPIFDGLLLIIYISEVKNCIVSSKYNAAGILLHINAKL
jgi:hypothetical protein